MLNIGASKSSETLVGHDHETNLNNDCDVQDDLDDDDEHDMKIYKHK